MRRAAVLLTALMLSCSPDGGGDGDASAPAGGLAAADPQGGAPAAPFEEHLTAQIDGADFAAQLVAGSLVDGELNFQSDQSQERQLFFTLPGDVEPGTYALAGAGDYVAEYKELFEGAFPAESGTLTVERIDREAREVSGTFEFTGVMEVFGEFTRVVITDGRFGVEYHAL
jgi:hypothetical protein